VADDCKVVSWGVNDDMAVSKLNAMCHNMNVLRRTQPRATYKRTNGTLVSAGIKILAGRVVIDKRNNTRQTKALNFGNFFSTNCSPVMAHAVVSDYERGVFVRFRGEGQIAPRYNKAYVDVLVDKDYDSGKKKRIDKAFYVDFHAIGY